MQEQQAIEKPSKHLKLWSKLVSNLDIELQGNDPVSPEDQGDRRYIKQCTVWFSMNFNLISLGTSLASLYMSKG